MAEIKPEHPDFLKVIHEAVETALKQEISRRFDVQKKILIADLDRQKDEVIAGITLTLMKDINFERMGNILTIRLTTK